MEQEQQGLSSHQYKIRKKFNIICFIDDKNLQGRSFILFQ